MRVVVLGAGLMGTQIGCEYALGGHDVVLVARNADPVHERLRAALGSLERYGVRSAEEARAASARVSVSTERRHEADLLVESLPEELDLKANVLAEALASAPDAVVATNTSSLSIDALGEAIGAPESTVGTHYLNPPLLMPLVEVVAGPRTQRDVVDLVTETLAGLGKTPVLVRRDVPGFVWNRLQFALVREAVWLVEHGVASPETVDEVVRLGLARRWRHVGPFRSVTLGGVETWNRSGENIVPTLSNADRLPDLQRFAIAGGDPAADAAARDAALAGEL